MNCKKDICRILALSMLFQACSVIPDSFAQLLDSSTSSREGVKSINTGSGDRFSPKKEPFFGKSSVNESPPIPVEGPIDPNDYAVNAGDVFGLDFWGIVQDSTLITVDNEGKLYIPKVEAIDVKQKSLAEVRTLVSNAIRRTYPRVNFRVVLVKPREFKILVRGAVVNPGVHVTTQLDRVSNILARAGGIAPSGSRSRIQLIRNGTVIPANLEAFNRTGDMKMDPRPLDGDVIFVPYAKDIVLISGAIQRPGEYEILKAGETLQSLIERAEGLTEDADWTGRALVAKPSTEKSIKKRAYTQVTEIVNQAESVVLKPGFEIYIPRNSAMVPVLGDKVYVTGEVKSIAPQPFNQDFGVPEYLAAAGGLTERGKYSKTVIRKKDGREFQIGDRFAIDPGDIIYVPEVGMKFWQDHLLIVSTFLTIITTTLAIQAR